MGLRFTPGLTEADTSFLTQAVELGRRGWGGVHPNPMVGCVLVKDGGIIGEGWHEVYGGPHAEVQALRDAGPAAAGSTAYVSLEPCRHDGKTPACTVALSRAQVARVVFATADPGDDSGGGREALEAAGIEVSGPHLSEEDASRENPAFFHRFGSDRAWVAIKLATSLDGMINAAGDARTILTGDETRREVHRLRSGFGAVMVGANTARLDEPLLNVRDVPAPAGQPIRIVLDSNASLSSDSRLVRSAKGADGDGTAGPVWLFCAQDADERQVERLEAIGVRVHPVPRADDGRLDLAAVLQECRLMGVESILCEGGGELARSLIREGHTNRLHLFQAPIFLGRDGVAGLDSETGSGWTPIALPTACGSDVHLVLERC